MSIGQLVGGYSLRDYRPQRRMHMTVDAEQGRQPI
jgi:hypothetical protein